MACSKPRMTRVLKIIPAYKSRRHARHRHCYPTHDTGRKKSTCKKGKRGPPPHTTNSPSPTRVEKSKPATKDAYLSVHATHHTTPHNCTGTKNNTRTKETKIDMTCSKPRMTPHIAYEPKKLIPIFMSDNTPAYLDYDIIT